MEYKSLYLKTYHKYKQLNKRTLTIEVRKKIKHIHGSHIDSVINMFVDLLNEELMEKKELNIGNFINFKLVEIESKRYRNYYTGQMGMTKPYKKIFVSLSKKLGNLLLKNIDTSAYVLEKKKK